MWGRRILLAGLLLQLCSYGAPDAVANRRKIFRRNSFPFFVPGRTVADNEVISVKSEVRIEPSDVLDPDCKKDEAADPAQYSLVSSTTVRPLGVGYVEQSPVRVFNSNSGITVTTAATIRKLHSSGAFEQPAVDITPKTSSFLSLDGRHYQGDTFLPHAPSVFRFPGNGYQNIAQPVPTYYPSSTSAPIVNRIYQPDIARYPAPASLSGLYEPFPVPFKEPFPVPFKEPFPRLFATGNEQLYPSSFVSTITTPKPTLSTGYPKVSPFASFTYPTTAKPTPSSLAPTYTTPRPTESTTAKPIITGYPTVSPSVEFTYPTTTVKPISSTTFTPTTPQPTISTATVSPFEFTYPTTSSSPSFPTSFIPTFTTPRPTFSTITSSPLITGYPKVSPSIEFTYPTTPKPAFPTSFIPTFTTPRPTFSTISSSPIIGYPKVSPSIEFTYPTTPKPAFPTSFIPTFSTPRPFFSTSTIRPLITGYPKVSPYAGFYYPTSSSFKQPFPSFAPTFTTPRPTYSPTTVRPLITGYPKVSPSVGFSYPASSTFTQTFPSSFAPTFTTPRPSFSTTSVSPLITGYPEVSPSVGFYYPTSTTFKQTFPNSFAHTFTTPRPTFSTTTVKPLITGYPKVSPSVEFSYPTSTTSTALPTFSTTEQSLASGYPEESPSIPLEYPTSKDTTTSTTTESSTPATVVTSTTPRPTYTPSPSVIVSDTSDESGYLNESPEVPFAFPARPKSQSFIVTSTSAPISHGIAVEYTPEGAEPTLAPLLSNRLLAEVHSGGARRIPTAAESLPEHPEVSQLALGLRHQHVAGGHPWTHSTLAPLIAIQNNSPGETNVQAFVNSGPGTQYFSGFAQDRGHESRKGRPRARLPGYTQGALAGNVLVGDSIANYGVHSHNIDEPCEDTK